jgi:pimeloyl-ACP methyl ester carboxylesterase
MPRVRANHIDIEYESFGRDGDPTILLIAGFAAQLTLWPEELCRGLAAKSFRVIRFDNRDIGKSTHFSDRPAPDSGQLFAKVLSGQPAEAPYSLDEMAGDAAGLLDALGIAQAHIVGASMGGMIAQLFAAHYPGQTRSLVSIMSTTGRPDLPQAAPEIMVVLATPPKSTGRLDRIEAAVHGWRVIGSPGYRQSDAEIRATAEREVDRTPYDAAGLARQLAAIITAPPRNELLKSVRAPTLVLHGADDPLVPVSGGEDTAKSIAGAEWISIPGAGHDFPAALTPIYLQHIGDFIEKVETRLKAGQGR